MSLFQSFVEARPGPYPLGAGRSPFAAAGAARRRAMTTAALVVLGFGAVTAVAARFGAVAVLAPAALVVAAAALLVRPELATLIAVFLFYVNAPAILTQQHGVPAVLAGSVVLLFGIPLVRSVILRREPLTWDFTFALMLAYLAVLLVSSVGAKNPQVAMDRIGKFAVEGLLFYGLLVNAIRGREALMRVTRTALAAGALLGALTVYQEATGQFRQEFGGLAQRNYEFLDLRQLDREDPAVRDLVQAYAAARRGNRSGRANGPTDEPNRFAQILVVLLPLAVLSYRASRGRSGRLWSVAAGGLVASGLVFSGSRGAFATCVVLALLAAATGWIKRQHLLVGLLAALPLVPIVAPRYVDRIASLAGLAALAEEDAAEEADGAIRGRAAMMAGAAHVFLDHPLVGVGPGQYRSEYSLKYLQSDSRFQFTPKGDGAYAHSLYLELAAEGGVIGLAVFLSIFAFLLRALHRARREWTASRPELAEIATAFLFALVAYLGTALFLHLAIQRYLWLLVALASVALRITRAERGRHGPAGEGALEIAPRRPLPRPLPLDRW